MLDPRVLACQIENNKFIELCFDVKVWLLGLAQLEKIPIRAQAGRSPQGFEDALGDDMMDALRMLSGYMS